MRLVRDVPLRQVGPRLCAPGGLGQFGGVDAGEADRERAPVAVDAQGVAIPDREDGGLESSRWRGDCACPSQGAGPAAAQPTEPSGPAVAGKWPVLTQFVQPASLQGRCTLPGGLRSQLPAG